MYIYTAKDIRALHGSNSSHTIKKNTAEQKYHILETKTFDMDRAIRTTSPYEHSTQVLDVHIFLLIQFLQYCCAVGLLRPLSRKNGTIQDVITAHSGPGNWAEMENIPILLSLLEYTG